MFSKLAERLRAVARSANVKKPAETSHNVPVMSKKPPIVDTLPPTIKAANEVINTTPEPKAKPMIVTGNAKNIKRIAIHCTATREGREYSVETIRGWHKRQGWSDIGYHFVIGLDGTVERGRPEHVTGSHVKGFNTGSIGIVYVGGLDVNGKGKDTRTPEQKRAMADLVKALVKAYPGADVLGHRDHSPDKNGDGVISPNEFLKECPCFDVREWWASVK